MPSSHPQLKRRRAPAPIGLATLDEQAKARAIVPDYVTQADLPWLSALLAERERFVGQKRSAWTERIREGLPVDAPRRKLDVALRVLDRAARDRASAPVAPPRIRMALFRAAVAAPSRDAAITMAAGELQLHEDAMMGHLFADLPGERELTPLREPIDSNQLALLCNLDIIGALLARALRVRIEAHGNVRAVVRHAKLLGLLCQARPSDKAGVALELSGPFSLFRHTRVYGHALASLVPRLAWCNTYRLTADCVLASGREVAQLAICAGDPVLPARKLADFDSKLEERFARGFARLAPHWDVLREPTAIPIGSALVFPDFELRHRTSGARWLLEIVGYWTADYVERKLVALREARIDNLIVCIDEGRACDDAQMPAGARLVRFRRRIDPSAVLAIVEAT